MAFDRGLAERIRDLLSPRRGITEKKMFGGLAFMLNGYMVVGILEDTLMARVGPDAYAAARRQPHVREMDFTGKPLKGYVYVAAAGIESDAALEQWVNRCAQFVESLPPKHPLPSQQKENK
jgi:TfoX/Sxy family transcriptional regulator of competence genes